MKRFHVETLGSAAVIVLLLLGACASRHAVRCDSKLEPINPPHPQVIAEAGK
jgi:type IV pilus biogenesis protein CpaD/CtpE